MTKLAIYEEGEGKKAIPISSYYRSDYISLQMVKGFICGSIVFFCCLGIWGIYQMELLMDTITKMDLVSFGLSIFMKYVIFLGIYLMITYVVSSVRFTMGKRSLKKYSALLKKVEKMHQQEEYIPSPPDWD
ncbi:MAG: hypothetical protein RR364_04080 [Lachnospiraceae bacterium]